MIAALFDCDGTLTAAQFGRGLLRYCRENGRQAQARRYYASVSVPYLLNRVRLFPDEPLLRLVIDRLTGLFEGLDDSAVDRMLIWNSHQYLLPSQRPEVISRLEEHRAQDHRIIIVSAQFQPNLEKMGAALGAELVVGTEIERLDGRWAVAPPVLTGDHKRVRTLAAVGELGWEIDWAGSFAYADSYTDMALFEMVGNPIAVHPDARLDAHVRREGWERID